MTIAPEHPIHRLDLPTPVRPTTDGGVCRRTGCSAPAGPDGLCGPHGATQAVLRAKVTDEPTASVPPKRTAVRFVANIAAAKVDGWRTLAACRGRVEVMHPDGRGTKYVDYSAALALCARCPVVGPCREAGAREKLGVWGGTTPSQRFPRRRRRKPAA